jgi:glycosyltransferase involved in cell wall biosynthesis
VEGVTYLGFVPDSALREAYQLASALVMPSLHETVGLPMLEAMDAGTPVLAADRAYAHDVCEDAALFFDPLDARDLAGALVEVARDQAMRRELVARGCALVARRRAAQPYRRLVSAALEAVS